jgi:hypothetical protein
MLPEQPDGAFIGFEQSEQHVDRGRLAGPVWAKQRDGLAAGNRDIDALDCVNETARRAKGLDEAARLDSRGAFQPSGCGLDNVHRLDSIRIRRDRLGRRCSVASHSLSAAASSVDVPARRDPAR